MQGNASNLEDRDNSYFILAFIIAAMAAAILASQTAYQGIGDSDYFWHITLGRYIVENKSIFKRDIFSWIAAERGYVETAHSWLGSVILYLFSAIFSNPFQGAVLYNAVTMALVFFILIYYYGSPLSKSNSKCVFFNAFFSIFLVFIQKLTSLSPRPGNIGLVLFVLSLVLLHDVYENKNSKKGYWLPIISLLWANIHGGSVPILFAFTALFLILALLPRFSFRGVGKTQERAPETIHKLAFISILEIVAALLNPYGWRLFIYFFHTNNATTKKYVSEWSPANLLSPTVVIALAALFVLLWQRRDDKTIDLSYLLPVGATLFMTGKYQRIDSYLAVCTAILISHEIKLQMGSYEPKKLNTMTIPKLVPLLSAVGLAFGILACIISSESYKTVTNRKDDPVTQELVDVLNEAAPKRMFTTYNDGGYLIYHGFRSFIDSRADPFPSEMLEKAICFEDIVGMDSKELENFISEYQFDAILLSKRESLNAWLQTNPEWTEEYSDDHFVLFFPVSQETEIRNS